MVFDDDKVPTTSTLRGLVLNASQSLEFLDFVILRSMDSKREIDRFLCTFGNEPTVESDVIEVSRLFTLTALFPIEWMEGQQRAGIDLVNGFDTKDTL